MKIGDEIVFQYPNGCKVNGKITATRVVRQFLFAGKEWFNDSEHPADDDEPIDEAWLRSVGGTKDRGAWTWKMPGGINQLIWIDGFIAVARAGVSNKGVTLNMGIKTRGQLRHLCQALGIELKADVHA